MRNSTIPFSLFGAFIFNSFPLVALAQPILSAVQSSVISGNNNQVTQVINQTVIYRQNSGRFSYGDKRQRASDHSNRDQNDQGRRQRGNGGERHKEDSDD
jgi:hypothetical protein